MTGKKVTQSVFAETCTLDKTIMLHDIYNKQGVWVRRFMDRTTKNVIGVIINWNKYYLYN